jgi:preprotein translocase subunit SecB
MSEVNAHSAAEKTIAQPQWGTKAIYLRHASLETSRSPLLLGTEIQPEMKLELRVDTHPLEQQDEVVLDVSITARDKGNLLYLLKIQQAGCFVLTHFTEEQKKVFLNTLCPSMIYPYACHMATTLAVQAGFPPLHLMPIDFRHFYAEQQKVAGAQTATGADSIPSESTASNNKWAELAVSAD